MEHMLHLIGAEQNPCDEETIISLCEIIRQIGRAKHQLPRQRDAAYPSSLAATLSGFEIRPKHL
ncbi:hypothetical protein CHR29_21380 [Pseudomonas monteilii]|uniref:Uncharacterized protein n=1 Tax=Pseudomonas monteilii TaxID=76759 RepID=A0AAP7FRF3_9PSED|nr:MULTISPECIES: hypothetical protein [Pseudomonas]KPM66921.1 hypothetical protein HB4184_01460 [Pseudomonas putida]AYN17563.1 hypothetical protein CHR29_21380 [Pseudomonas monteilii]AYN98727.1 hypothetical protein D8767_06950 [Pseudomonas sp. LTGT-11-2Z]MBA1316962.1 hypothetical protein [Pseudomonas monteilii]MBA6089289.1 hypothetical protein [Pseudomonas monteilii]